MKIQLIRLFAALFAGGFVMILHEFPKAFIYNRLNPNQDQKRKRNIYKLHHYIDPIGIILCITNQAGFSKPYMYRIKDKRTNLILGITGLVTLLLIFMASMTVLRFGIGIDSNLYYSETINIFELILQFIIVYIAIISISMFIVNLFPVSTFDIGLCIAGISPSKYFLIIQNDYFIKMILLFVIMFQFITSFSTLIMTSFL